jgi:hypothetical protein
MEVGDYIAISTSASVVPSSCDNGGLFERRSWRIAGWAVHGGEQVSNKTRASCGIFSGKVASLPEAPPDLAIIEKCPKGGNGLPSIPLGVRTTRLFPHRAHFLKRLATKTLFKQVQGE